VEAQSIEAQTKENRNTSGYEDQILEAKIETNLKVKDLSLS